MGRGRLTSKGTPIGPLAGRAVRPDHQLDGLYSDRVSGAEASYAALVDEQPDGLLVADGRGRVTLLNAAARQLLGDPSGPALGRDYRDVLPLCDACGRSWWEVTKPYDGLRTRTGQPEHRLTYAPVGSAGRDLYVTARYIRDDPAGPLTRLVVSLRDGAARDRQSDSSAELVSTVAHELRSPLTSVKGFTATLLSKWDRFDDDQKLSMLATVNADADRLTRLISELLDVSRIDSGQLQLRHQVVDLTEAAARVLERQRATGQPAERFRLAEVGAPSPLWLDADKLDRVLDNLVGNAVHHGAGTVTVTITAVEGGVEVTVADEGRGLPAGSREQIFNKYWRGAANGAGIGLGLYLCKGLVEAHGGTIRAESGPGGGALLRFRLPAGTPGFVD